MTFSPTRIVIFASERRKTYNGFLPEECNEKWKSSGRTSVKGRRKRKSNDVGLCPATGKE